MYTHVYVHPVSKKIMSLLSSPIGYSVILAKICIWVNTVREVLKLRE